MISLLVFVRNNFDDLLVTVKDVYDVVDEVVIIDSLSDGDLRSALHDFMDKIRIYETPPLGIPEPLMMYGISKCRSEWILNLDVGNTISDYLRKNLRTLVAGANDGYSAIKTYMFYFKDDGIIVHMPVMMICKVFRKGKVTYKGHIHEDPDIEGKVLDLTNDPRCFIVDKVKYSQEKIRRYMLFERSQRKPMSGVLKRWELMHHSYPHIFDVFLAAALSVYWNINMFIISIHRTSKYNFRRRLYLGAIAYHVKYDFLMFYTYATRSPEEKRIAEEVTQEGVTKMFALDREKSIQHYLALYRKFEAEGDPSIFTTKEKIVLFPNIIYKKIKSGIT
ncbi:MAG: hypothetical protein JRN32_00940 [Nitrososphaerota archaeon]|jgi:hypothetical protein|nr:hypothetical protein [Nitrososphaerota archaeon]MDG7037871.1 hypothetical protein [Nitrososphaerota archaeon]MDG7042785.1 hypothetical protein [Nitrososphaerota archaeon]MDG7045368.1 hypothetical protein [Nitrososphaerota archaeon]